MKQEFAHYTTWEDFQSGMYQINIEKDKDILVFSAVTLLKDQPQFYQTMKQLISDWGVAAKVNMTNQGINRRAWLGAAACCYAHRVPEVLTRLAWSLLNKEHQDAANRTAEQIISEYEKQFTVDVKTLFDH